MAYRKYRETATALSEMDSQRALLDSLMGVNRNNDREQDKVKDYHDPRICKNYLLGLCPHDLFGNTKMDLGQCTKFHTEEFKRQFEENLQDFIYYENLLEKELLGYLQEADKKIKRARERLECEDERDVQAETNPQILKLNADITRCVNQVEAAGESGNIDYAQDMMARVDALLQERFALMSKLADEKSAGRPGIDVNEKLRACDICGAFLSIYDSDQRLADHFVGKLHLGFQTMRNKLDEINRRRTQRKIKEYEERMKRQESSGSRSNPPTAQGQSNEHIAVPHGSNPPSHVISAPTSAPQAPSQPKSEENGRDHRKENGRASEKEISSRGRHQNEENNNRRSASRRSRSSSRSGSISSLGSESSAIIRRRKRRQNMERGDPYRERDKERKRDRRDRSESEGRKKRKFYPGDNMSEEEGEERDPSVPVKRPDSSRDTSRDSSKDRRSYRY